MRKLTRLGNMTNRKRMKKPPASLQRSHLTACYTAIRCGQTPDEVLDVLAGTHPHELRDAYRAAANKLRRACRAWDQILADPSQENLDKHGDTAALVAPTLIAELRNDPTISIEDLRTCTARTEELVKEAEQELKDTPTGYSRLLERLDAPGSGLRTLPCFIPRRVGALTSTRLAHLLEEK